MNKWLAIAACISAAACTRPNHHRAARTAPKPQPVATASAPSAPPTQASAPQTQSAAQEPIPPLSSPNPRPAHTETDTAATAPPDQQGVPHVDPRETALRRAGESAQACYAHAGLPAGTAGKLMVEVTLASDGSVEHAEVDRSRSSPKLVAGKLENCVLEAVRKQTFPAPRSGTDVTIEIPLEFRPTK